MNDEENSRDIDVNSDSAENDLQIKKLKTKDEMTDNSVTNTQNSLFQAKKMNFSKKQKKFKRKKKSAKSKITHPEFLNFVNLYFFNITEKQIKEFEAYIPYSTIIQQQTFLFNNNNLPKRLYCSYILNNNVRKDIPVYNTPLKLSGNKKQIDLFLSDKISDTNPQVPRLTLQAKNFLAKAQELNSQDYREMLSLINEHNEVVKLNTRYKNIIREQIDTRIKPKAYFKLYELIHKELNISYLRKKTKRKHTRPDIFEESVVEEYLLREEEFISEFGNISQFSEKCFIYNDILTNESAIQQNNTLNENEFNI